MPEKEKNGAREKTFGCQIEKYPMGKWHIERNEPSYMRKLKKHYRKLKRR